MPSLQTPSRVMFAASISRRSHQHPATTSSLGPIGPARTQGSGPSGISCARASGKAAECFGGPSPLHEALLALHAAWARAPVQGCPPSACWSLAPERMTTADR
eukprot:1220961-Alexandrium_andersonii.AAC.1